MNELEQIHKFLLGEGPLHGLWFGDKPPIESGRFWWRKYLREAAAAMRELEAENRLYSDALANYEQHDHEVKEENVALHARVAELEAENRLYSESLANATQDIERLRGLCNWAAGRLLDYGDVVGHEHVLTALEGK